MALGMAALGPFPSLFLMQGRGIALAMAKPMNLTQSSAMPRFLTPALLPPPHFLGAGGGSAGKHCPEPPHVGRSGKEDWGEHCASGVPQDPSARQPPPTGTSQASRLPTLLLFPLRLPRRELLWPVKLYPEELCPLWLAWARGESSSRARATGAAEPARP